jgi:uncharacterized protein (TIGR03000 family)
MAPAQTAPVQTAPVQDDKKGGGKSSMIPAPATIVVALPADARLTVDDAPTTSTTARRVFVSPELNPGVQYNYTFKAEFVREGKPVTVSKIVTVTAGAETNVNFEAGNAAGVASR